MRRFACLFALLLALGLLVALPAGAIPTPVESADLPQCDPLVVPALVDELGIPGPFPPDESIGSADLGFGPPACLSTDVGLSNPIVLIHNLTVFDFIEVWYVADRETSITNADGLVNFEEAFRIDAVGVNTPLLFESMTPDGIFEAGEIWHFVIQDYVNGFGLPASFFDSVGVGGFSPPVPSSGSIIAIVPEPTTAALLALGLAGLGLARRRPN